MIRLLDTNHAQRFYVKYANRYDKYVSAVRDIACMQNEHFTAYKAIDITPAAILTQKMNELVILYPHYQTFKDHEAQV